jgi:hypothetical protein
MPVAFEAQQDGIASRYGGKPTQGRSSCDGSLNRP